MRYSVCLSRIYFRHLAEKDNVASLIGRLRALGRTDGRSSLGGLWECARRDSPPDRRSRNPVLW